MGMDLIAQRPHNKEPYPEAKFLKADDPHLHYNWAGWRHIWWIAEEQGVDTLHFTHLNDGDLIPSRVCKQMALALGVHIQNNPEDKEWLEPHISRWQYCGGFRQW